VRGKARASAVEKNGKSAMSGWKAADYRQEGRKKKTENTHKRKNSEHHQQKDCRVRGADCSFIKGQQGRMQRKGGMRN